MDGWMDSRSDRWMNGWMKGRWMDVPPSSVGYSNTNVVTRTLYPLIPGYLIFYVFCTHFFISCCPIEVTHLFDSPCIVTVVLVHGGSLLYVPVWLFLTVSSAVTRLHRTVSQASKMFYSVSFPFQMAAFCSLQTDRAESSCPPPPSPQPPIPHHLSPFLSCTIHNSY